MFVERCTWRYTWEGFEVGDLTVHSAARLWERAAVLEFLPTKQIQPAQISHTIMSLRFHKKEAVLMLTPSLLCA